MHELSKSFWIDAAHSLHRAIETETSRRIHGHSYRAVVVVRGEADPETGMVVDVGHIERAFEAARLSLDHRLLDEVEGLGPPTIENLCAWIWRALASELPGLVRIEIHRESYGDTCAYFGPDAAKR